MVRMSSFAASVIIKQMGLDPMLQMVTRDRNRLAMQSDIIGAYPTASTPCSACPGTIPISATTPWPPTSMTWIPSSWSRWSHHARRGQVPGRRRYLNPPKMFIGAAANPFADPFELRVARLAKKVKAGVDFIQTQCIYNLDKFESG
jgi:methylenetetrahydrofolate reductase (NADPH)